MAKRVEYSHRMGSQSCGGCDCCCGVVVAIRHREPARGEAQPKPVDAEIIQIVRPRTRCWRTTRRKLHLRRLQQRRWSSPGP